MARKKKVETPKSAEPTTFQPMDSRSSEVGAKQMEKTGKSVLIDVIEQVNIQQDHNVSINSIGFKGTFVVENPSKVDRVWNVEFDLSNIESTDLEAHFEIRELGTEENDNKFSRDFQITGEKKNLLLVKEYINTSPSANDILNPKDIEAHLLTFKDKKSDVEATILEESEEKKKEDSSILSDETKENNKQDSQYEDKSSEDIIENVLEEELEGEDDDQSHLQEESEIIPSGETFNDDIDGTSEEKNSYDFESNVEERLRAAVLDEEDEDVEYMEEDEEKTDLESWTMDQLLEYCDDNLIDVPENATKEEIISIIREAEDEMYDGGIESDQYSLESFGISKDKTNTVTFAIAIHNLFEKQIQELTINKTIPKQFENVKITYAPKGKATIEGEKIEWTIESLDSGGTIILKFTADILVETHELIKTGDTSLSYKARSSFTGGLEINEFKALSRNKFHIDMIEKDEEPDVWDCTLVFENPSEFVTELIDINVHDRKEPDVNFVQFSGEPKLLLSSGEEWRSESWRYESEDYPSFEKKVDFKLFPEIQTNMLGTISLEEVGLVLASITGTVSYEIEELATGLKAEENEILIPSYKNCDIKAILVVENNGSAPLNDVFILQKQFDDQFTAPMIEELTLYWDGNKIEIPEGAIMIEDDIIQVRLKGLKDAPTGMFEPESKIMLEYPIHMVKPQRDAIFETDVLYTANTYPKGQEIEFVPEADQVPVIKVIHIRRKYRVGKEIIPIGTEGRYQIQLLYTNVGDMPLNNFVLLDKVPDNFTYSDFSLEPTEITDQVGTDTLIWKIETLEENETLEILYEIKGSGEYRASDAQLSL
ncbi:MAG: hypothetical protein JW891_12385 [Candidatus Lokiarchaeota archaeon]|nr:hypothetical protein [Candidatus Lokiarchaeota archaeon]